MKLTKKGTAKKAFILEKATAVFIREGYTAVTMKDIVEECGISRGGLYRYYFSTKEIFVDILSVGKEDDNSVFAQNRAKGTSTIQMLTEFFENQKRELLGIGGTIRMATYEFFFSQKAESLTGDLNDVLRHFYAEAVEVLSQTIQYGIARGEITKLSLSEADRAASQIVILLEGLEVLALTKQITPALIDEQIGMIMDSLFAGHRKTRGSSK
jgi:AcrR family transcriptional regulator